MKDYSTNGDKSARFSHSREGGVKPNEQIYPYVDDVLTHTDDLCGCTRSEKFREAGDITPGSCAIAPMSRCRVKYSSTNLKYFPGRVTVEE